MSEPRDMGASSPDAPAETVSGVTLPEDVRRVVEGFLIGLTFGLGAFVLGRGKR